MNKWIKSVYCNSFVFSSIENDLDLNNCCFKFSFLDSFKFTMLRNKLDHGLNMKLVDYDLRNPNMESSKFNNLNGAS